VCFLSVTVPQGSVTRVVNRGSARLGREYMELIRVGDNTKADPSGRAV
jgi:hypothetical protein